jgi:hypothetical protein
MIASAASAQCGKPSVAEAESERLCVDCWYEYEVARTIAFPAVSPTRFSVDHA